MAALMGMARPDWHPNVSRIARTSSGRSLWRVVVALCLLGAAIRGAAAADALEDGDSPRTSLVTMGPGKELYERFAHNAIWLHDPSEPAKYQDVAFNYGLFSFGGDFIPRFVLGRMRYWMGAEDYRQMIEVYREDGRHLVVQELDLTPAEQSELRRFLWDNAREENRFYTYNYYSDNCSTRVRDALDRVLGGQIKAQTQGVMSGHTYRWHTRRIVADNPVIYVCLEYVLGHNVDREITVWEEMFLPEVLRDRLRGVRIQREGRNSALVVKEATLAEGSIAGVAARPPVAWPWFGGAAVFCAGGLLALNRLSARSRVARYLRNLGLFAWVGLSAFAGCFLGFVMTLTDHWATYWNENILQMSPVACLTLAALPWALWQGGGKSRFPKMARLAGGSAILTLGLSAMGLGLKVLPGFFQDNGALVLWVLPTHGAVAMILRQEYRGALTPGKLEK